MSRRSRNALAAPAVALALLGGCGGPGTEDQTAPDKETSLPASRTATIEPMVGCIYDYQPMKGPRAMARAADLVVRGTIGRPRAGLVAIRRDGSRGRVETDIVPIEVTSVLAAGPSRADGDPPGVDVPATIEVEIGCAFPPPRREAKLASLAGRETIAYLVRDDGDGTSGSPGKVRYAQGAPDPRYREAALEGLLIELASGNGVRNLSLGERYPDADLEDFHPERPRFPAKRIP